jgi:hypothetical protein
LGQSLAPRQSAAFVAAAAAAAAAAADADAGVVAAVAVSSVHGSASDHVRRGDRCSRDRGSESGSGVARVVDCGSAGASRSNHGIRGGGAIELESGIVSANDAFD